MQYSTLTRVNFLRIQALNLSCIRSFLQVLAQPISCARLSMVNCGTLFSTRRHSFNVPKLQASEGRSQCLPPGSPSLERGWDQGARLVSNGGCCYFPFARVSSHISSPRIQILCSIRKWLQGFALDALDISLHRIFKGGCQIEAPDRIADTNDMGGLTLLTHQTYVRKKAMCVTEGHNMYQRNAMCV